MHPLVRRQLRKAFGTDSPESVETPTRGAVREFALAASDAYLAADEDRQRLESSLELASAELYERNAALEERLAAVTRLEKALDARNRAMAMILDHVAQGFVVVGIDGALNHECSRALTEWFGPIGPDTRLWNYVLANDPDLGSWMELGFDSLRAGMVPAEIVIAQLPTQITCGDRQLRAEYRALGEPVTAVLVVISDITDELARQHAERQQRELLDVVERVGRDRAGFMAFLRSTDALIEECRRTTATVDELARSVHTLKGNAALFGITTVAEVAHHLESQILEADSAPDAAARDQLFAVWGAFRTRVGHLLDLSEHDLVIIDRADYREVVALLGDRDVAWARRIRQWGLDPTRAHLERLGDEARVLAAQLGKATLEIEIADHAVCVDGERFAPVWTAVVHAVRNAVAHGLETREQRVADGKPANGRLVLTTRTSDEGLVIEIADDGRGIDVEAVTARARALGSDAEGPEAVFVSGLSTADEVTELAGRGIGMGALQAACVDLGGRIELTTTWGAGTTVRCVVPLSARRRTTTLQRIPVEHRI